jgi:hypothetical protein
MDTNNLSKLWVGWKPPEGLNRSWPRPAVLTGRGVMLYVLAALMLVGGVFGAVWIARESWRQRTEARRMVAAGRDSEGAVTRLWRHDGKSPDFRVAYKFAVDGRDYTGHASVGSGYWMSLHVGSPIAVRYLPSAPARNFPAAYPPTPTPAWLAFLIGGMGAVAGVLLPLKVRRQRHLLEDGRPAPAVVARVRRLRSQHGTQNIVYYQFALPDGGVCKGRSNCHDRSMLKDSVICILYDPDNPRRSAPYPLCTVKLVTG